MSDDPTPKEAHVPKEETLTIEQAAQQAKAPAWAAAALKARHGWPIGKRLTPSEYRAKLDELLKGHTEGGSA